MYEENSMEGNPAYIKLINRFVKKEKLIINIKVFNRIRS